MAYSIATSTQRIPLTLRWSLCLPVAALAAMACKWGRDLLVDHINETYPTRGGQVLAAAEDLFGWWLCGAVFSAVLWRLAPAFKRRVGWGAVSLVLAVTSACGALVVEHKVRGWGFLMAESGAQLLGMAMALLWLSAHERTQSAQLRAFARSASKSAQNPSRN